MAGTTTRGRKPKEARAHGEGSICQRSSDGKWVATIRYIDPMTGKKVRKYVYGKTRPEVVAKKHQFEEQLRKGVSPTGGKMTVEYWLNTWLETYAKLRIRENTLEGYQRIVVKHLIPTIGNIPLKELRPEQIQAMLNQKLVSGNLKTGGPLGARQVEYIYAILHMALEQAAKNGLVARNVCDLVDKPKKVRHEFMPWTTEQTNQFLTSVKNTRLYPLYALELGTGLRRSELLGLKWEDIDFKKGTLTVRRTLVRVKGGYKFGEPKTQKSRRTIPLPDTVIQALKAWKKQQAAEKMQWNALHAQVAPDDRTEFNPMNLVFTNEIGGATNPDYVGRQFQRDSSRAGLPHIRFHDLRHGHATMLLELGEDIKVISDRLGHSTITLTADTYSHVRERLQREASNKLDQVLQIK